MANSKNVSSGSGVEGVAAILNLLGGQKSTTSSTADTSALTGVLSQLQGQNYDGLLQGIFQKASGELPGLTSRLSNAVGARSGNNGAVQALLQKTLADTTLQAQQQIATQQNQNLATQANVAGNIASATRGSTTKTGLDLLQTAKALGGLKALSTVTDSDLYKKGKAAVSDLFGLGSDNATAITSAPTDFFGGALQEAAPDIVGQNIPDLSGILNLGTDFLSSAGSATDAVDDFGQYFADGGLVGRDGTVPRATRKRMAAAGEGEDDSEKADKAFSDDADRAAAIKRLNDKKKNPRTGKELDEYDKKSSYVDQNTGIRFADGGQVTINSAGGRKSSAPSYTPDAIQTTDALNTIDFGKEFSNQTGVGGTGGTDTSVGTSVGPGPSIGLGKTAATVGKVALSALAGNPLGIIAALADVATAQNDSVPEGTFGAINSARNAIKANDPLAAALAVIGLLTKGKSNPGQSAESVANSLGESIGSSAIGANAADSTTGSIGLGLNSMGLGVTADNSVGGTGAGGMGAGGDGGSYGYGHGEGGSSEGGGGYGVGTGGAGAANGGPIKGPGNGTSDSIPIRVSNGEYIVPADVVNKLGVDFFDNLREHFHLPVNQDSPNWKKSAPADSDGE
jgi:hypothetical protein